MVQLKTEYTLVQESLFKSLVNQSSAASLVSLVCRHPVWKNVLGIGDYLLQRRTMLQPSSNQGKIMTQT